MKIRRNTEQNTISLQNMASSSTAIRKYKTLTFAEKISCLIVDEEIQQIETGYREMQVTPSLDQMSSPAAVVEF